MKNQKIIIEKWEAYPLAEKRFLQTCGFDLTTEKHQRMMAAGRKIHQSIFFDGNLQGVVSFYGPEVWQNKKLIIEGLQINCNYIEKLDADAVVGLYVYLFTAGKWTLPKEVEAMDWLYADIWGNSYVDAGIELLKEKLKEALEERFGLKRKLYLSEEIGPGYFGMPVTEMEKLFRLVDGSQIGVERKTSGAMVPEKTCGGIYMVLNRKVKAEPKCTTCQGNLVGCNYCKINGELQGTN